MNAQTGKGLRRDIHRVYFPKKPKRKASPKRVKTRKLWYFSVVGYARVTGWLSKAHAIDDRKCREEWVGPLRSVSLIVDKPKAK